MHPVLDNISENEFLTGPDSGDELALDIDWVFGKEWSALWSEMQTFDPQGLIEDECGITTPSDEVAGYRFKPVGAGLLLLAPDGAPIGGYLSCDVSISAEHQGKGLGKELIIEYFLRHGSLPTWHLDTPAYTPAGARAHRSAYRAICSNTALIQRKLTRLDAPALPAPTTDHAHRKRRP